MGATFLLVGSLKWTMEGVRGIGGGGGDLFP